jgi:hypothetical protein
MAITYEPIATTSFTSVNNLTFTSIPATYTDLYIVFDAIGTTVTNLSLQFNADTGSNYSQTYLLGDGSSASSGRNSNQTSAYLTAIYTDRTICNISIMNYANTTTYKTCLSRLSSAAFQTSATVNLWRSTAAITSVKILDLGGAITGNATLYGIKSA